MGSACAKTSSTTNSVVAPTTQNRGPNQAQIRGQVRGPSRVTRPAELSDIPSLDNPQNVNHKYKDLFEILQEEQAGTGIKQTLAYRSKIPIHKIEKLRIEFWETRVEGYVETWNALRSACETDEETGIAILTAVEIKLINRSLQLAYDSQGNKYEIPIFCINDPTHFDLPKKKQLTKEELSGETIKIPMRRTGVPNDVQLKICNNLSGLELKKEYIKNVKGEELDPSMLRLFFGGKEIVDDILVAEYGVQDERVVTVFKKK
jgi:hypothetical protein